MTPAIPPPVGMLAELTHRCPLKCAYCSNPLELVGRAAELDTATWSRLFREAAALGVLHVHLSGGEPAARQDLEELVAAAAASGLYTNLITSGLGLTERRVAALADAGLAHVQLSFQAADDERAERIAGVSRTIDRKRAVADWVRAAGLPLTINVVLHRLNASQAPAMIGLALDLGAARLELAHAQFYGWGLLNRQVLMPTREQVAAVRAAIADAGPRIDGRLAIDYVAPDYFAKTPKACMGGWGRKFFAVTPSGRILPCHAAETIEGLDFPHVRDTSLQDAWDHAPAFNLYRGTTWMKEPCRSCSRREVDFGGCRCQAYALLGDAAQTDPACSYAPGRTRLDEALREAAPGSLILREGPSPAATGAVRTSR